MMRTPLLALKEIIARGTNSFAFGPTIFFCSVKIFKGISYCCIQHNLLDKVSDIVVFAFMASSSSSSASPKLYDVFISHRGPDVKETLAKRLYELLQERGCKAFLDCPEIQRGVSIRSAISSAICSSLVQIAIFSKGYAESSWCLDELVQMLNQQPHALFIPVFYDVQPWELRHIEHQESRYAAAFSSHRSKDRDLDKLDEWKKGLQSAADISGYEFSPSSNEDNFCENIVSRVLQVVQERKNRIPLGVAKYPVGLAELVEDFESRCSEVERQRMVRRAGIYGLGGSGKTTLAKELFNMKRSGYDASCFLSDVRESSANSELHCLQSQLLKDIFSVDQKISNVHHGIGMLKDSMGRAKNSKFLIILDDIDHQDQLDALLPEGVLSSSSLVIITTRDESMLRGADISYKMKEMCRDNAKDLFCSHAFHNIYQPITYTKLVESFVEFCGGLPLSLKVLGAHLYGRDEYYWDLQLEKVKKILPGDVIQRLKISFDSLDHEEKQIFIDIACLFNKKNHINLKNKAILIWKASCWSAEHAVQTLQEKCLVELSGCRFEMHDHLRDLGRQMADELGPPRLWKPDILRSMKEKGLKKILEETEGRCFHSFRSSLKSKITYFLGNSKDSAETDLLWLEISNLKVFPSWIPLTKLQSLSAYHVQEMWSTFQQQRQTKTQASFELKRLHILYSPSLEKLPDLIVMFSHLEELEIVGSQDYINKIDIPSLQESLRQLSSLRSLKLRCQCSDRFKIKHHDIVRDLNFGASTGSSMTSLEIIEFSRLASISKLLISGEICPGLRSLTLESMMNLKEMNLNQLERLNNIDISYCNNLETISELSSLTGLQFLRVTQCPELVTISGLSSGLQLLTVRVCPKLKTIPQLSSAEQLGSLFVEDCPKLETISGLSSQLQSLTVKNCQSLETISASSYVKGLQSLTVKDCPKLKEISASSSVKGLQSLTVKDCPKLKEISGLYCGLQSLFVKVCHQWETISGLSSVKGNPFFEVENCPQLEIIPGLFPGLGSFTVKACCQLKTIAGLSYVTGLRCLTTEDCSKLGTISGLSSFIGLQSPGVKNCEVLNANN